MGYFRWRVIRGEGYGRGDGRFPLSSHTRACLGGGALVLVRRVGGEPAWAGLVEHGKRGRRGPGIGTS